LRRRELLRWASAFGALLGAQSLGCRRNAPAPTKPNQRDRIVSLAPAITETLFKIGAGPRVVAVSDYCDSPPEVSRLPRVGTSLTPNYEAIARLSPTLILGEDNPAARRRELEAIGRTRLLRWLSLAEIDRGVRELGTLTQQSDAANRLADELVRRLSVTPKADAPRVLLVLGGDGSPSDDVWFVRRNSLHGAALQAAGARNAIDRDIDGPPQLSREALLSLDPPWIVVLSKPKPGAAPQTQHGFEKYPTLGAVKSGHAARLQTSDAFANGPRILDLVNELHSELQRLGALP
jgi:iron complex transport system substrate-binding protein